PFLALAAQQRPQALLADTVGGCSIQQVDTQVPGLGEQFAHLVVIWQLEAAGVFDPLVAADLDGTQAQRGHREPGAAQEPVEAMQVIHETGYPRPVWRGRAAAGRSRAAAVPG